MFLIQKEGDSYLFFYQKSKYGKKYFFLMLIFWIIMIGGANSSHRLEFTEGQFFLYIIIILPLIATLINILVANKLYSRGKFIITPYHIIVGKEEFSRQKINILFIKPYLSKNDNLITFFPINKIDGDNIQSINNYKKTKQWIHIKVKEERIDICFKNELGDIITLAKRLNPETAETLFEELYKILAHPPF